VIEYFLNGLNLQRCALLFIFIHMVEINIINFSHHHLKNTLSKRKKNSHKIKRIREKIFTYCNYFNFVKILFYFDRALFNVLNLQCYVF
jgi:hypothetical protein